MLLSKRQRIENFINENNYDLHERMITGSIPKIAKKLNIGTNYLQRCLYNMRHATPKVKRNTYEERNIRKFDAVTTTDIRKILTYRRII